MPTAYLNEFVVLETEVLVRLVLFRKGALHVCEGTPLELVRPLLELLFFFRRSAAVHSEEAAGVARRPTGKRLATARLPAVRRRQRNSVIVAGRTS